MSHHRPLDEICTILIYKDDQFCRQACQDLHEQGGMAP
jgi:predicted nucleic acid-binding Zn ribbon protein